MLKILYFYNGLKLEISFFEIEWIEINLNFHIFNVKHNVKKSEIIWEEKTSIFFFFLWRYSCQPTPEPQQYSIWATSATYTTGHSSAGSLTHWARPGIKPATPWFLVGFASAVLQRELWIIVSLLSLASRCFFNFLFDFFSDPLVW